MPEISETVYVLFLINVITGTWQSCKGQKARSKIFFFFFCPKRERKIIQRYCSVLALAGYQAPTKVIALLSSTSGQRRENVAKGS